MTNSETLARCGCGGEANIKINNPDLSTPNGHLWYASANVSCTRDGCIVAGITVFTGSEHPIEQKHLDDLISRWNRAMSRTFTQEDVERVTSALSGLWVEGAEVTMSQSAKTALEAIGEVKG